MGRVKDKIGNLTDTAQAGEKNAFSKTNNTAGQTTTHCPLSMSLGRSLIKKIRAVSLTLQYGAKGYHLVRQLVTRRNVLAGAGIDVNPYSIRTYVNHRLA